LERAAAFATWRSRCANPAADGLPVLPEVEFYWRDEGNQLIATLNYVAHAVQAGTQGEPFDAGPGLTVARWMPTEPWVFVELVDGSRSWYFCISLSAEIPDAGAARAEAVRAALAMQVP